VEASTPRIFCSIGVTGIDMQLIGWISEVAASGETRPIKRRADSDPLGTFVFTFHFNSVVSLILW